MIRHLALQLLTHYRTQRVVIFTSHRGLMNRDREDFADYFKLAMCEDRVEYCLSLNVTPRQYDIFIFDEADHFIFK